VTAKQDPLWWHLALLLVASASFESLFLKHSLNVLDEGWPLYAAMRLHAGGTLYQDVFFVFPPGHVLAAWIGYGLDPPGILISRAIYAAFNVSLCVAMYFLGRQLMPASFALLGGLILAFSAPQSHDWQLLFGYRYLVWTVLALLAFQRRVGTRGRRWMLVAGILTGTALCFRLTPAFAVGLGIGVASLTLPGSWRGRLEDVALFGFGIVAVVAPVAAWFAASVGIDTLWLEVVERPVAMTALQSRPVPPLELPPLWNRYFISESFVGLRFRLPILLYGGYLVLLAVRWVRSVRRNEPFDRPLLLAVVVWGASYFLRSLGRSDAPHLDSAIPPLCLLLAHSLHAALTRLASLSGWVRRNMKPVGLVAGGLLLGAWVFLYGSDTWLDPANRGWTPVQSAKGQTSLGESARLMRIDRKVLEIQEWSRPGDTILDLSASPMLHVLTERLGPGYADLLIPGTFLDGAEEEAFLRRLMRDPPSLVIAPVQHFDRMQDRAVETTAPRIAHWVRNHYEPRGDKKLRLLLVPRSDPALRPPP